MSSICSEILLNEFMMLVSKTSFQWDCDAYRYPKR